MSEEREQYRLNAELAKETVLGVPPAEGPGREKRRNPVTDQPEGCDL